MTALDARTRKGWAAATLEHFGVISRGAEFELPNGERYYDDGRKVKVPAGAKRGLWPAPEDVDGPVLLVVEGPADVLTAHELGFPAVSVPTAGYRLKPGEAERLTAGRHRTIVIADADEPGRAGARKRAVEFAAHGPTFLADLEPDRDDGFDLGDVLVSALKITPEDATTVARRFLADRLELAEHVYADPSVNGHQPDASFTARGVRDPLSLLVDMAEAMRHADEPLPYVIEPLALLGTVTMLVGRHSSMKSWLAQFAAAAAHAGDVAELAGMPVHQHSALYVDAEMGARSMGRRFKAHGIPHNAFYVGDGFEMQLPAAEPQLRALIETTNAKLVIIDSLRRIAPGVKENDSDSMAPLVAVLARISRELDVAILLVHHRSVKINAAESRGSSSIEDQVDAVFALERVEGDPEPDRRRLRTIKFRHDEEPAPCWISIKRVDDAMTIAEAEPFEAADEAPTTPLYELVANRIAAFSEQIERDGGWSRQQIGLAVGVDPRTNRTLDRALAALILVRDWTKTGSSRATRYHPPIVTAPASPLRGEGGGNKNEEEAPVP